MQNKTVKTLIDKNLSIITNFIQTTKAKKKKNKKKLYLVVEQEYLVYRLLGLSVVAYLLVVPYLVETFSCHHVVLHVGPLQLDVP